MMALCARRETCSYDVRQKLRRLELSHDEVEEIVHRLQKNQFIDDQRYARAYIREKLEINRWGRTKISYMLRSKGISSETISRLLAESKPENYEDNLDELLRKKLKQLPAGEDRYKSRAKLIRFAASRGFEADLIFERVNQLINESDD